MKLKTIFAVLIPIVTIAALLLTCGCVKKSRLAKERKEPLEKETEEEEKLEREEAQIDFHVQNITGHTIYVTCFSYIKKRPFGRWRWDKSDVYKLENNQSVKIDVDTIPDEQNRKNVYGSLAIFDDKIEAEDSIYELLNEKNRIDLDQLFKLKDEKVLVQVEKYGFKGETLDFNIVPKEYLEIKYPQLDFVVENKTGKTIYLTCFAYQLKDNLSVWKYDKAPVKKLNPGKHALIDIDTIVEDFNQIDVRGALGIFEEHEEKEAQESTFELLKPKNKIELGRFAALKNKKIVLTVEKYGAKGDIIDFSIKPTKKG